MCMTGVSATDIIALSVTGSSSNAVVKSRRLASSSYITATYTVSVNTGTQSYDALTGQLQSAISKGQFNGYLQSMSAQTGATGFASATSDSVSTNNDLASDDSDDDSLSDGAIAGIVIGAVAFVALVAVGLWFFCRPKQSLATQQEGVSMPASNPMANKV